MRPTEFTTEQIIEAGKKLLAADRKITGFALRGLVGGGNALRLKQVWDEHLTSETQAKSEPVAVLPVEVADELAAVSKALTERLAGLAVELNDKAVKAAERRVTKVTRDAEADCEVAAREVADASVTVDDLEAKLDVAKAEAEALGTRLAERDAAHQALAVELAQVRERLALSEQTAKTTAEEHAAVLVELVSLREAVAIAASTEAGLKATVDQMGRQIQMLTSALERGHAEHEAARQAHAAELARAAETARLAQAEHEAARQEHAAALARTAETVRQAQAEAADLRAKLDQANAGEAALRSDLAQLRDQFATATAERDGARREADAARGQAAALGTQRDEAQAGAVQAREQAASLRGQVDALREQSAQLLQTLKPAAGKTKA